MKPKDQELVRTLLEQGNTERKLFTNAVKLVVTLSTLLMAVLVLLSQGDHRGNEASDVLITTISFFGGSVITGFALLFTELHGSRRSREKLLQKLKKRASDDQKSISLHIERSGMFKFLEVLCFLFTNGAYILLIIYSTYNL